MSGDSQGRAELERLAEEFLARRRRGEDASVEQYAAAHPGLRAEIEEFFPTLLRVDAASADVPERVGPYRILRELGRGGMGVVYVAEDERLARRVALKVLAIPTAGSASTLLRFRREAEIASRLDHPGICTVYEAGEHGGVAFIAMRLVEGETLAHRVERMRTEKAAGRRPEVGTAEGTQVFVALAEKAARALHAAHEAGLIHRDVKPGNIMVGPDGEPVVLDFGLARPEARGEGATLTQTGALLGTPAYMSPEQVLAGRFTLDRRTDVYSLGATLYECLTLRTPFEAATFGQLCQQVVSTEPEPPDRANRAVSRDLRVVVGTAMAKDRARRYATALDLAEDLRRVRERLPIRARPLGPLARLARWARRRPAVAASLALAFASLATGLGVALNEAERARAYLGESESANASLREALRREAEEKEAKSRALVEAQAQARRARALALAEASARAESDDPMESLLLAREAARLDLAPAPVVARLRAAIRASKERVRIAPPAPLRVHSASYFPDGRRVLVFASDGSLRVHDLAGRGVCVIPPSARPGGAASIPVSAAVSPGGDRLLATFVSDPVVRVWDASGAPVAVLAGAVERRADGDEGTVVSASFAPKGGRILTAGTDGCVRVWGESGECERVFRLADAGIAAASWHPDGHRILTTEPGPVRLWDVEGNLVATFAGAKSGDTPRARFSPEGDRVLAAFEDDTPFVEPFRKAAVSAKLWDLAGTEVAKFHGAATAMRLAMSRRLGSAREDAELVQIEYVLVVDSHRARAFEGRGLEVGALPVGALGLQEAEFAASGRRILGLLDDGSARLWSVSTMLELLSRPPFIVNFAETACFRAAGGIRSAELSPDEDGVLVRAAGVSACSLFDVEDFELTLLRTQCVRNAVFSHRGDRFVTAGYDGTAAVHDADGSPACVLRGHAGPLVSACFSPDDGLVLTASEDGTARTWTRDGAAASVLRGHEGQVRLAVFSPDGSRIATASDDRTARIWTRDGTEVAVLRGHEDLVHTAVFSAAGDRVLTASDDGTARAWSLAGDQLAVYGVGRPVWFATFLGSDGAVLAYGHRRKYHEASGEGPGVTVHTFSNGGIGDTLAMWDADGTLRATFEASGSVGTAGVRVALDMEQIERRRRLAKSPCAKPDWTAAEDEALASLPQRDGRPAPLSFSAADGTLRAGGRFTDDRGREAVGLTDLGPTDFVAVTVPGGRLLTGDAHRIRLWLLRPEDLLALASRRCLREFTADERSKYAGLLE